MSPAGALQPILQTASSQRSIVECYMLDPGAQASLPLVDESSGLRERLELVLAAPMDDKQHWPPTCFEEKQGTSPLLLPLRPRL